MSLTLDLLNENSAALSGELTRHHVARLANKKHSKLFATKQLNIDLTQVVKVDTSGLAWLLLLVEKAHKKNLTLSFSNLPNDLVKLAKLSAVDSLLPVQGI